MDLDANVAVGPDGAVVKLRASEAELAHILMSGNGLVVRRETVVAKLWGAEPPLSNPFNQINVMITRMRPRFKPHGVTFENVPAVGWFIKTIGAGGNARRVAASGSATATKRTPKPKEGG